MNIGRFFIALLFITLSASAQEKIVSIHNKQPLLDPSKHAAKDVEVYRTTLPGKTATERAYGIAFYRVERDTVRLFRAYYGGDIQYNGASYKWDSDTSFTLKLFNSKNKKMTILKVFGNGTRTGFIEP